MRKYFFDKDQFLSLNWDQPTPLNVCVILFLVALTFFVFLLIFWGMSWALYFIFHVLPVPPFLFGGGGA